MIIINATDKSDYLNIANVEPKNQEKNNNATNKGDYLNIANVEPNKEVKNQEKNNNTKDKSDYLNLPKVEPKQPNKGQKLSFDDVKARGEDFEILYSEIIVLNSFYLEMQVKHPTISPRKYHQIID